MVSTPKGDTMRLLLTAAFLMTAASGAAFAEGRYQLAGSDDHGWLVLDTETGAVKFCHSGFNSSDPALKCSPWFKNKHSSKKLVNAKNTPAD